MALDGFVVNEIKNELIENLVSGHINKITMPNKNEIILEVNMNKNKYRLLLSSMSIPLVYLTSKKYTNPTTPYPFCMLLRKYISGGKIIDIIQPDFERCLNLIIENIDEFGDIKEYKLVIELTGKYNNIILLNNNDIIIDSIKHITSNISSIRYVIPKEKYFLPNTKNKLNPRDITSYDKKEYIGSLKTYLSSNFTGVSTLFARIIADDLNVDENESINNIDKNLLINKIQSYFNKKDNEKKLRIYYDSNFPVDFYIFENNIYNNSEIKDFSSISELIEEFYNTKQEKERINDKISQLKQVTKNNLSRAKKKYKLQSEELLKCSKLDTYKLYAELLQVYNSQKITTTPITVLNYYDNTNIEIPIDTSISLIENSNKYYKKYNKLKRAKVALSNQLINSKNEIDFLEEILLWIDLAKNDDDINEIKHELYIKGYIKKQNNKRNHNNNVKDITSSIIKHTSNDGYTIFIGRNNVQNDYISTELAKKGDYWFHAKKIPGGHILVKLNGNKLSDETCIECAKLAAFYSSASKRDKVEIDYLDAKNLKKVKGQNFGYVIYHTNYSIIVKNDLNDIK